MDWWNNQQQQQSHNWWEQPTASQAAIAATPQKPDDGGFFGGVGSGLAAVGGFFGDIGKSIVTDAKDAVVGLAKIAGGQIAAGQLDAATKIRNDISKQHSEKMAALVNQDDPNDPRWNSDAVKQENAHFAEANKAIDEHTKGLSGSIKTSSEVDPAKTAAAAASTFLNVVPVGGIVKAVGGGVVRKVAPALAETVLKKTVPLTAEEIAANATRTAAARTLPGVAKTVGRNALEGGAYGGAMGGLGAIEQGGMNTRPEDVWQQSLMGLGLGAGLGAAGSILDKNVRVGVKDATGNLIKGGKEVAGNVADKLSVINQHPQVAELNNHLTLLNQQRESLLARGLSEDAPAVKQNATAYADAVGQRNSLVRSISQGGYIKIPGGKSNDALAGATDSADAARRQLNGEDITNDPNANYINEQVAGASSPQQYLNDTVNRIWNENKKGKGVDTWLQEVGPGEGSGYSGRAAMSNNGRFYSDYYKEFGKKPTKQDIRDMVEQELTGKPGLVKNLLTPDEVSPVEADIYQQLQDREAHFNHLVSSDPSVPVPPAAGSYDNFANDLGNTTTAPEAPGAVKVADPTANTPIPVTPETKAPVTTQQVLGIDPSNPYHGMVQDLTRPQLPQGDIPTISPAKAKRQFASTGEAPTNIVNKQRGSKNPIELPGTTAEGADRAVRETPGGKLKPLKLISKDEVGAIRQIAQDDTSSQFTMTKTPSMNLSEAFKKRGGEQSEGFRTLDKYNTDIREHSAALTRDIETKRTFMEKYIKEYKVNGKVAEDMRPYLESGDAVASKKALDDFVEKHGEKAGEGLKKLRVWWRATASETRNDTNAVIKEFAGEKKMMGDLGPTYVPRVYKTGVKGFKSSVLDVMHAGMDKIGGKDGMFNLANGSDYLSKETENMGGILRNSEGIPLNSEFAKPNTSYLSAAEKRTAKSPVKQLEDPLTSMMRYFDATARARYLTPDIAKGQEIKKAIELVNNESGNLRQMYKSFDDQVNSLAGKTSRLDRPIVDSAAGAKFVDVASKMQGRISRSTILGSASSAFAQTGQLPLVVAENGVKNFATGMSEVMKYARKASDVADPMKESAMMTTRYPKNVDRFTVTKSGRAGNKGTDIVSKPFRIIEHAASELAWRSSYSKALENGLEGKAAVQEADRITAKIIGERSPGARAALYESRAASPITAYTLEVNQLYQVAKTYFKHDPKRALKLVGAIWLYNQGYQALTGNKLNADPIAAGLDAGNDLFGSQLNSNGEPMGLGDRLLKASGRIAGEAIDATPLGGPVAGALYPSQGFRVPFGGGARVLPSSEVFGSTNFGRYGGGTPIASGLSNPLLLLGIPGMGQLQRSAEGLQAYDAGASTTAGGTQRFQVGQDPSELWRSILFGQYGTQAGRDYLAQKNANLAGH